MFEHLPEKFKKTMAVGFGDDGKRWLINLPEIIAGIEESWALSVKSPFPNLSYHYVAPCVCAGGEEAVLKIGFPGEKATTLSEIRMLKFLGGDGVCRLLRFDETRSALLLEKLSPGENLKTICKNDDKKAVGIAINVMRNFWRKPPEKNDFPKLEDWFKGLEKAEKTEFNSEYVKKARRFFEELTALSAQKTLLHGDFHHENILSASREPFLAIDPKGIIGDIGYDLSIFMINHADWLKKEPNRRGKLNYAIRQFSEAFEIEPQSIKKWIFAFSVLSAWWTFEENSENWRNELDSAEIWDV